MVRGENNAMARVEEVKHVALLRGKRVIGEWETCVCVDNQREDPPSLVKPVLDDTTTITYLLWNKP